MSEWFSSLSSRRELAARVAELEAELARAREDQARRSAEAEAAIAARSEFLANLSHEIRTPLNAILGFSALVRRLELPPKAGHYLRQVSRAGETLRDIVNDVLDLSKLEADMMRVDPIEFRLGDVLSQVVTLTGHRAAQKGLELVVAGLEQVDGLRWGDPLRLGQVLTNLVGNAVKFTASGHVLVRLGPGPSGPGGTDAGTVRFEVEDTGIGMSAGQQAVVFQAFVQAGRSTAREFGGTGLGLTIASRLVELMGGHLELASAPGAGATFGFTVELPLREAPGRPHRALKPGARALLAGAPERTGSAMAGLLEAMGFQVHREPAVAEALAALEPVARQAPFDLVLLCHRPPELDGIQAGRAIRRNPWLKDLPVILLVTSLEDGEVAARAEREGLRVLLSLPALPDSLAEAVLRASEGPVPAALDSGRVWFGAPEVLRAVAGARVLLVDDNAINRELGTEILASAGLRVTAAASGTGALRELAAGGFDLVLLDIEMPGMDGYATAAAIRASDWGRSLPVVALTAHALAGYREKCLAAGMNDFVPKPIEIPQLFRVLNRWLPAGAAAPGPAAPGPAAPGPATPGPAAPGPVQPPAAAGAGLRAFSRFIDLPATLNRLGGDAGLLERALAAFARDPARPEEAAEAALARDDLPAARRLVHPLRGLAGTLGMTRAAACCAELEACLEAGDPAAAGAALKRLQEAMAEVRAGLAGLGR
jgi:signal transduction histidine kinase/CheY-like chemotaxis protein/HPt (histidine-containing phosphotransfer) domain-containing protein